MEAKKKKIEDTSYINDMPLSEYMGLYDSRLRNAWVVVCENKANKPHDEKEKVWVQTAFQTKDKQKVIDFIESSDRKDYYITANAFKSVHRVTEDSVQVPALILDLDIYKSLKYGSMAPEDVLPLLERDYFGKVVPYPNGVVFSGYGLYLVYDMQFTPGTPGTILKRKVIMKILFELLKDFGADSKSLDAAHVFRLPGTINGKNGEEVEVYSRFNSLPGYTLQQLQQSLPSLWDVYKKERKIVTQKEKKSVAPVHPFLKGQNLAADRLKDLKTIAKDIFKRNCEGYREHLLFLTRNFYHWMHEERFKNGDPLLFEESQTLALQFNDSYFIEPLPEEEVLKQTLNRKKLYRYSQAKINELFDLDLDAQIKLNIKTPEAVRHKNKIRLRKARGGSEKGKRAETRAAIVEAITANPEAPDYKIAELVKAKLGKCSDMTVKKVRAEL
ncbi:replication protein (plasmid) [Paenibacillus urinalis]|uniref:Replication protein n=1 Tax=Paenibacillus urinalis TaxID=521520 RepID=A0AAX3N6Z6_9BACL|nr:replication protein [Paenibacillus urinalis]WDH85526.1 replication protein [Paenibacillus urinalis]WDI00139.1 replication protein [Paenibacillus urinalis]WDI05427.1 replication protein [Paenibacillus urinalis]